VSATPEEQELNMRAKHLTGVCAAAILILLPTGDLFAQDAPDFMKQTYPKQGLASAWQEHQAIEKDGALDAKTKQLIGLGVAAQIPCAYCVYYHTKAAKADGATEDEIKEAVAEAALTRKWSTVLNGSNYSMADFKKQVDAGIAKTSASANH
jgi:AhpD family alkylhydroperoxidase